MALKSEIIGVNKLNQIEKLRLFELMQDHYDGVALKKFEADLSIKDKVIVVKDQQKVIRGFSTIVIRYFMTDGKRWIGVFSGDTIVEKKYWGQSSLQIMFTKFVFIQKIKNINQPVYWFLISKGYKTYLLLANNFLNHYPRYEKETSVLHQTRMDIFYSELFGTCYNSKTGHVRFDNLSTRLKSGVAPITAHDRKYPRIAFFEKLNPDWENGTELACVGEVTILNAILYCFKKATQPIYKNLQRFHSYATIKNKTASGDQSI